MSASSENLAFHISDILVPYEIPHFSKSTIAFIAEAPGATEEEQLKPLVGDSGKLFNGWLKKVGIERSNCMILNTFRYRPDNNKIVNYFVSENIANEQGIEISSKPKFNSKRLIKKFESEIEFLISTIITYKPLVIVTLGAIATWSLLDMDNIGSVQGHIFKKKFVNYRLQKSFTTTVIPCYHPASVLYSTGSGTNEQEIIKTFELAKSLFKQSER
jgi:uracil-DNA glycosylase